MLDNQLREFFNQQMQKVSTVISANKRMINNYSDIISDKKLDVIKVENVIFNHLFKRYPDPKSFLIYLKSASGSDLLMAESTYSGLHKRVAEFHAVIDKEGTSKDLSDSFIVCKNDIVLYDDKVSALVDFLKNASEVYYIAKEILAFESNGEILNKSNLAVRFFSSDKRKVHSKINRIDSLLKEKDCFKDFEGLNYKEIIAKYDSNVILLNESKDILSKLIELEHDIFGKINRVTRIEKELASFCKEKHALRVFEKAMREIDDKSFLESIINNQVNEFSYQVYLDLLLKINLCEIIVSQFNKTKQSLRNMQEDLERNEHKLRNSKVVHRNFFDSNYEDEINRIIDRISESLKWADKKALIIVKNSDIGENLISYIMNTIRGDEGAGGICIFSSFLNQDSGLKKDGEFISMLEFHGLNRAIDINNPFARNMESFEIGVIDSPDIIESNNASGYGSTSTGNNHMDDDNSYSSSSPSSNDEFDQ
jgi:hypothetical protein